MSDNLPKSYINLQMSEYQLINTVTFYDECYQFLLSKEFWFWHGIVLIIDWFGIAFIAILIQKNFYNTFSRIIHTLLFIFCTITTLIVNAGAIYKTYINWHRFPVWGVLNKSHKLSGVLFSLILIWELIEGIKSSMNRSSRKHRKYGYALTYFGMITCITGLAVMRHYNKAIIFTALFILQYLILKGVGTKTLLQKIPSRKNSCSSANSTNTASSEKDCILDKP